MSGPTPMTLGPYAFQALGFSYAGLARKLDTSWSSIDVAGRMEALHWLGPKSEEIDIKGCLFPESWGGQGTLDAIRSASLAGAVLPLITGDGNVLGLYAIQHIDEDRSHHDRFGQPRKNTYTIKLKAVASTGIGGLFAGIAGAISGLF